MSDENKNLNNGFTDTLLSDITQKAEQENLLNSLLEIQNSLEERTKEEIIFKPPLVTFNDTRIIEQNTINAIQGAAGSHKSRLVETLAALMLSKESNPSDFCGFDKYKDLDQTTVTYIDTERNLTDQLPYALQRIKERAGFKRGTQLSNFRYTSLIKVPRKQRFKALKVYLSHLRAKTENHIFAVIDVGTDCVSSFNNLDETNEFFDFLNLLINEQNLTFLIVIHENPGGGKARGHMGTELLNKASGQFRIGYDKDAQSNNTDVIRMKFLKLRMAKPPQDLLLTYCNDSKGLVLAPEEILQAAQVSKQKKANLSQVMEYIVTLDLKDWTNRKNVAHQIEDRFDCSNRVAIDRIKTLYDKGTPIPSPNKKDEFFRLYKQGKNGKAVEIRLVKINQN